MKRVLSLLILTIILMTGCTSNKVETTQPLIQDTHAQENPTQEDESQENESQEDATREIVDAAGRTVIVPNTIERVVVTGVGGLRLYAYAGDLDKLVGVEAVEHQEAVGRPYTGINQALFSELQVIGQGGPKNGHSPEEILAVDPDVIFTTYDDAETLQATLNIPVIVLDYGSEGLFNETLYQSLEIIGDVMGRAEKAAEQVQYIKDIAVDLNLRTESIPKADRPSVYLGAMGNRGAQGIESTQGENTLLQALNIDNVVDETGASGGVIIDKEQLLTWNPAYIFIDMDGYSIVAEDYGQNTAFYEALSAFQNGNVYGQLPFNYLTTNIDTALADAYFIGKTVYPDRFTDIDPIEKADEIYTQLLGAPFYSQMESDLGGFKTITSFE